MILSILLLFTLSIQSNPNVPKEILDYNVYLGPLKVGSLKLERKGIRLFEGESVYHFLAILESEPKFNFLFQIKDTLQSFATIKDFKTLWSYKSVQEGPYHKRSEAHFDYSKKKIIYHDGTVLPLIDKVRDLLTLWFYLREIPLESAESEAFSKYYLHLDKKDYEVNLRKKKRNLIKTPIGKFYSWEILPRTNPLATILGSVYLSDDSLRLPLIIKTSLLWGQVKAVISQVRYF